MRDLYFEVAKGAGNIVRNGVVHIPLMKRMVLL